ncbi:uncharacterized protein METZ01_LOCUS315818, partial [marine metagenome]
RKLMKICLFAPPGGMGFFLLELIY